MQSRRDLAKTLGLTVAALPFTARAAEPTPTPTPTATPEPQPADAVALALTQAAVAKFALTAEEATKVGESIVRIRRSARVLAGLKLSPFGRLTAHRQSGERVDMPRVNIASISAGDVILHPRDVGVWDVNAQLPDNG